jgi:hypothetical protein
MFAELSCKRGDAFSAIMIMPERYPDGHFLGWSVAMQLRKVNGTLISTISVSWLPPENTTRRLLLFDASTSDWPIGVHESDVQFVRTSDGHQISTKTFRIEVQKEITWVAP